MCAYVSAAACNSLLVHCVVSTMTACESMSDSLSCYSFSKQQHPIIQGWAEMHGAWEEEGRRKEGI